MTELHFANSNWAHTVWLVLAVVGLLLWLDSRGRAALDRFLSLTMQSRLAHPLPRGRRWLSLGLLGLAAGALVVALMRPQGARTFQQMPRAGAQIMVCLDVSKSMLAEDTAPNRLDRAKAELSDLLTLLDGDQVGLIAFAGKAAVVCPLTPDFGFYKLILDGVGPHSVGRGGTRLEEPIRKALAGFRTESDVSRVILLVTDGEDHDSYPVKAAEEAAERGIKIIAIGFGDEAGSQVQVTDPKTGVRTLLKDRDGKPVNTRLDGETLREIALVTEGMYVPAGTGALDLESIHQAHIAPLVRGRMDDQGHVVRSEYFQWTVLAGLVLLIVSVTVGRGSATERQPRTAATNKAAKTAASVLLLAAASLPTPIGDWLISDAHAQPQQAPRVEPQGPPTDQPQAEPSDGSSAPEDQQPPKPSKRPRPKTDDPRTAYNQALALLNSDLEQAEQLLTTARRDSGTDGEVRFRATYNMGWVEVKRADGLLDEQPEQALVHLGNAADWFRDAVRLREDNRDARHNLEIILRRITELADSLREQNDRDLTQQLDDLIQAQRGLLSQASSTVQDVAGEEDPNGADRYRMEFRRLAVEQRKVLSDSQALSQSAREELDSIEAQQDNEKKPDTEVRAAQLTNALHYLNQANQRMGQARSQMRRQQGERSFRRAASALEELKRARDQFRDPVEVLSVVLSDATQLAGLTNALASTRELPVISEQPPPEPPAWLTLDYLEETQHSVTERTGELAARLKSGLDSSTGRPAGPLTPEQEQEQAQTQRTLDTIRQAMPFIEEAVEAFGSAGEMISADELDEAVPQQFKALVALEQARERFLDLRRLIELVYTNQSQIQAVLMPPEDDQPFPLKDLATAAGQLQDTNVERSERLARMLDEQLQAVPAETESDQPDSPSPDQQQHAATRQRLKLATELLGSAKAEMQWARTSLEKLGGDRPDGEPTGGDEAAPPPENDPLLVDAQTRVKVAVQQLQALRRLFFSLVEHLRETAQRQAQLNDETEQVVTLANEDETQLKLGPLLPRQQQLQSTSSEIATALEEQSKQGSAAPNGSPTQTPEQEQQQQQITAKLAEAGKLVAAGADEMQKALEAMTGAEPQFQPSREHQNAALEKLAEALALLVPPQPQQNQPQEQPEEAEEQQDQQQAGADPSRMLQAVRDREAKRRKEKSLRPENYEPVEKDW